MNGGNQAGAIDRSTGFDNTRAEGSELEGLSYYRSRYYDQATGAFTQEDPIGIAGGMNLYQYAGNNPATFTDPFGLCKRYRDGSEDPECRQLVNELTQLAVETDKSARALGVTNPFRAAAEFYERTDREVEFVDLFDKRLNRGHQNSDSDPTTMALGMTMPYGPILIRHPLPAGDRAATAVHEGLAHGNSDVPSGFEDVLAIRTDRLLLQLMPAGVPAPRWQQRVRYFRR